MPAAPVSAPAPVASAPPTAAAPAAEAAKPPVSDKYETITSPIVGTFYRAPSPDSDPYAEVGTVVDSYNFV